MDNVSFSPDEHAMYNAIQTRSQLKFNKYLERGTVMNNYAYILVLLLRLRQACCHPNLINDLCVQVATEGIGDEELRARAKKLSHDVVKRLKEENSFECPICMEPVVNATIFLPCGKYHFVRATFTRRLIKPCFDRVYSFREYWPKVKIVV
jgi:SNF2 family DNA or RNA helicase